MKNPKEEPKQDLEKEMFELEQELDIPTHLRWHNSKPKQIKCYDKFNQLLKEGDYVDVQKDGVHQIYLMDDNQLYFKPYGKEDKVSSYFSNDIAKCDKDGNWLNDDRYESIVSSEQKLPPLPCQYKPEDCLQETLEEFIKRESKSANESVGIVKGAKWQEQNSDKKYSENEVLGKFKVFARMLKLNYNVAINFEKIAEEWFEKFKKK